MSTNRVIAITGASKGIGRATALRLARDGASVAMCARRGDLLDAAAREVAGAGGQAPSSVADVASVDDMDRFVWLNTMAPAVCDRVVKRFGRRPICP